MKSRDYGRLLDAWLMHVAIDRDPDGQTMSALQQLLAAPVAIPSREFRMFPLTKGQGTAYLLRVVERQHACRWLLPPA
ncbi:hypothetical protein [Paraburkholderia sp. Ac-20347]|uniref:hypothetical protein n=1 Tax=Paraburkholderia sp. Ac-20347 TaxID=2703892 RepID=UPI00197EFF6E|nr:hypothetical protein [Paraburkholderia sp. Ac-20347]MBN3807624.1 hypothetical protein [Paraburkholderia sp. Ac-20347]